MLVPPGPGILVTLAGLAVLAAEFAWARRALDDLKNRAARAKKRMARRMLPTSSPDRNRRDSA